MELESDLAKELFNKVIVPLQTKNKEKELTVQNEYKQTQEQLQEARNEQKKIDELRNQGAKAIAAEKANRLEAERLAKEEAERVAREDSSRLAKEAAERVTREAVERVTREAAERVTREAAERVARETAESARLAKEEAVITNIDQATVDDNIPPAVSKENINFNLQGQLPPKPPIIETCKAKERDIDPSEDCNPNTQKAKPKSWLRFHPDKNPDCKDIATEKFKKLTTVCEKYTPSSTTSEPTNVPTTSEPTNVPTTSEPTNVPTTSEPSGTAISTDMLVLPASEPTDVPPSTEQISTELDESILESPIQNKFDVNPLIETVRTTLNKDMVRKTMPSQEPSAIVPETIVPEIVSSQEPSAIVPETIVPEIVSSQEPSSIVPETIVPEIASSQEPVPKFNVNQLINTLNQSLATSVPSVEKTIKVGSPKPSIDQQNNETEEMYMSDLDKVLEEAKKKQYVDADSLSTPVTVPALTPVPTSSLTPVPTSSLTPVPTSSLTPVPTSVPEPVSATTESFDWKGKLDWLKQSVGLLIGSLSNMFTFKPAEDNDPYKLSPERENEGYIYIGKMYMKEEDGTSPSKQVKYVNYHPDKKDFYIDERTEVVN